MNTYITHTPHMMIPNCTALYVMILELAPISNGRHDTHEVVMEMHRVPYVVQRLFTVLAFEHDCGRQQAHISMGTPAVYAGLYACGGRLGWLAVMLARHVLVYFDGGQAS